MFSANVFSRAIYSFVLVAIFASVSEAATWSTPGGNGVTYDSEVTFIINVYAFDSTTMIPALIDQVTLTPILPGLPNTPFPGMTTYYHNHGALSYSGNYSTVYGYVIALKNGVGTLVTTINFTYSP